MRTTQTTTTRTARPATMLVAGALLLGLAAGALGDTVRLRAAAKCAGPKVVLGQVADLDGPDALALADMTVVDLTPGATATVTLDAVRAAMDRRNVHWGRVSLSGVVRCRIEPVNAVEAAPAASVVADSPAVSLAQAAQANPNGSIDNASATSLREKLAGALAQLASVPAGEIRVALNAADEATVSSAIVGADRFEFEPQSSTGLGRVPVTIRRWRGERMVETIRLAADVSRRVSAVVAVRPIDRGDAIQPTDVEVREAYVAESLASVFTDAARVVRQTAVVNLRAGTVVGPQHLRSPTVIRRGDAIVIRCISGGLVVKTVGRAGQDGGVGDVITARNERSRDASGLLSVRVTGPGEGVIVAGGASAKPEPKSTVVTGGAKP